MILSFEGFSQNIGDYRSAVSAGNWAVISSWEYYNGSSWVTPSGTAPQGYPGQFVGTGTVTIRNSHTITLTTSVTNLFTKLVIGEGVSGVFVVGADIANFNTLDIFINSSGIMSFVGQYDIKLPVNAGIRIIAPGKIDAAGNGDCTNNTAIFLGDVKFGVCKGAGNAEYTFVELNNSGGTLFAAPSVNSPQCVGNSIDLVGNYHGPTPIAISYSWSIKAPDNSITNSIFQNFSFTATQTGVYQATLTCNANYGTVSYSNSETISILVNPLPATPTVSAVGTTTFCTGGSVTLTSSVGTSYSWSTGEITQSIIVATSGNYTVKVANANGCQSASSAVTTVTVNPLPVIVTQPVSQLDCEDSRVNFKVIATGTDLSYVWKYKKPTDLDFITLIGTETNTSYPKKPLYNEISLANVGSTQYPNGTQFQVVVSNGSCSVTSSSVVLSVNEIVAINSPVLTPSQSVTNVKLCSGSNYSYTVQISNPSNGPVSYQWKSQITSGSWNNVEDGPHFSGAKTATLNIINGTPAESAKYRVDIVFNRNGGNCSVSSFSRDRSLTFAPLISTPELTISQPDCTTSTGVITVSVQNVTDTYSFDNGLNYQSSNIKSGLAAGIYTVLIKNASGCISTPTSATIKEVPPEAIWDSITQSWTNGPPTSTQALVFNGTYNSTGDLTACSCQVNSGSVTIKTGHTLTITNGVTVSGGSLTFEDQSSLVQINNSNNSGNITYRRLTTPISNFDYTYWSSPVTPQTLYNVSPKTLGDKFYSFNGATNNWVQESTAKIMEKGIGYIIRGPQDYAAPKPLRPYEASFVGVPNNGTIIIPINTTVESSYLLGNPYPSALDADSFLRNNAILNGTLYFWTHNTNIGTNVSNPGSGIYAYSGDDYASYNLTGGVGTGAGFAAGSSVNPGAFNDRKPSGKIGSGQGFFVTTTNSGTITFANTMRVGVGANVGNNTEFFKIRSNKSTEIAEKNRVWLNLFNVNGIFKQVLVGYITGATNDIDSKYDGDSFDGNEFLDFYSISNEKKLVIQGRSLPFDKNDKVPLGYRSSKEGSFTIGIDQVDGLFEGENIFIEDKLLDVMHDLKKSSYTFTTEKGTFNDRFVLGYTNKTLGVDEVVSNDKTVLVSTKNKEIKITASNERIDAVWVYDFTGKQIYKGLDLDTNQLFLKNLCAANTALVVKIKLESGRSSIQKIMY